MPCLGFLTSIREDPPVCNNLSEIWGAKDGSTRKKRWSADKQDKGVCRREPANSEKHRTATPSGTLNECVISGIFKNWRHTKARFLYAVVFIFADSCTLFYHFYGIQQVCQRS